MAQRRALREIARRLRLFTQPGSAQEAAASRGKGAWSFLSDSTSSGQDAQQLRGYSSAGWALAAGGATAFSAMSASAGSIFSTEAETEEAGASAPTTNGLEHAKKAKVVFVLGGPGSGKGTQCSKIVDEFGFTHLSAGDLLRAEIKSGSEYGTMIQTMIKEGKIVPAEVTVGLLKKAMEQSGNDKFLIDGFPRNDENREVFERDTGISPEFILFFDCPEEVMEKRLLGRNQGRVDDNIETIKKRFKTFVEQSMPVVAYFEAQQKVHKIDATKAPDEVFKSYSKYFTRFIQD